MAMSEDSKAQGLGGSRHPPHEQGLAAATFPKEVTTSPSVHHSATTRVPRAGGSYLVKWAFLGWVHGLAAIAKPPGYSALPSSASMPCHSL
ncbi:hypothetical protein CCHR01_01617 [Colletotrichum chrysophilum]|uniref:Uncharacterized protein n=1 Tax=Colletotrichum chrysophilum TaxID=1836956 RepID=A0AAD9AW92_9PEZI|nr:hypothetical protein CCHR01_01617 [Colletotrichum chrysophilum]